MVCKKCGAETLADGAVYCAACGTRLDGKIQCENCNQFNNSLCIKCEKQFEIINGKCQHCYDSNCEYCEGRKCLKCKQEYLFNSDNECISYSNFNCLIFKSSQSRII